MAAMQMGKSGKAAPRTVKDFNRRRKPIRQFDTSDLQQLQLQQVEVSVVRSDANHLLMTSLLEQLCNMYVSDRSVARQLFKKLCEQLSKLNIIAPLSLLDEMSGLRNQHRSMFNKIMNAAMKSLKQPLPALPGNNIARDRLAPSDDDIIGQQTSRYKNEFQEIELLGKGGFGSVYKARNYLDGSQYAVKKIRFKHRHTHKLIKLLREVKALASLQHSNIVGYNAAWMEYDSPFSSSNSSSSGQSPRSKDSSPKFSRKSSAQGRSVSIEFLSDAEDEQEASQVAVRGPALPGGAGMAFSARACSSFKVEELRCDKGENVGMDTSQAQNGLDLALSPRQHVRKVDVGSKSHHYYQSQSISSSISISENPSNHHSNEKSELLSDNDCHIPQKTSSKLPVVEKQIFQRLSVQQDLEEELFQSSSHGVCAKHQETSTTPSTDTSVVSFQHLKQTNNMDSDIREAWLFDKQRSYGFSTSSLRYRRHHSQPESGRFAEDTNDNSSSCKHHAGENKNIVARQRFRRRSVSFGTANGVEEVIELCNHDDDFYNSITLYIQMELCGLTLQEWLVARNSDFSAKGFDSNAMGLENMHIFHQLLQGVQFIHSCGFIHRDLKPRNIFLSSNNLHVKIGDFGLAKVGSGSFSTFPTWDDVPFINENHTSGVGTSAYASPEQLEGSFYDSKSDMFSLGVILFEIFNIFCTEMERVKSIENLRSQNQCDCEFRELWPSHSVTVEALTSPESSKRPSAQELLNNDLFLSQEQKIQRLQERVKQQDAEIGRMKKELLVKNRMIAHMQARFHEFFPHFSPFSPYYIDQ